MKDIWVVDDDDSIRWVLSRALENAGHKVTQFDNAESAIEALRQSRPAVLVTDNRMGTMSGLELAQYVQEELAGLPVIIMTAHTDLDSALASYQSGAFEYLPKPFDLQDAVNLVNRASVSPIPRCHRQIIQGWCWKSRKSSAKPGRCRKYSE